MNLRAWALALLPAGLAGFLVISTWGQVRFTAGADEGVYLHYASRVAEQGPAAFRGLARAYLDDPRLAKYPPPFRLATVGAQAAAVRLFGKSFRSLQVVSLASFLALLLFLFFGFRRLFDEKTAFLATLLLSVSPLHLGLARRALSDSLSGALSVLCLLFFIRFLTSGNRSPKHWWGLAFLYIVTFLTREGTLLLVPVSFILAGFHCVRRRERPSLLPLAAVSVIPAALALAAAALACGGWEILRQVFLANFNSVATNPYVQKYGTGPWYRYLMDFLLISPAPTLLYLLWAGALAAGREKEEGGWLWALVPLLFLPLAAPITKNIRYALMLETPIRLGAVGLLRKRRPLFLVLAMAGMIFLDGLTFCNFFVTGELYDPVTANLLALRGFLPR